MQLVSKRRVFAASADTRSYMTFPAFGPAGETSGTQSVSALLRQGLARRFGHILREDAELLVRWRARLTAVLLLAAATLGVIPCTFSIVVMAREGQWLLALVDLALLVLTFTMLFSTGVTNGWRNIFLASGAWLIGVTSLVTIGPFSTALGWMFMSVFMAAFLLSTRATVFVVASLLFVLAGVAWGIASDWLWWARGDATTLSRWALTAVDFSFLISLFAASNRFIIRLLESDDAARVSAEQQLAEGRRNEALGTLASGIAHDFNNLLVPVLANVEMVHDTLPEHSAERAALYDAQRSAERARDLVQRILSFGRGVDANRCVLHLADVAAEVVRMTSTALPHNVSVSLHAHTDAPVLASVAEAHQIIHNLVTNAVHALNERGEVIVHLSQTQADGKQWVQLSVTDTGVGMDSATRERIFDPYFSTREVGRGTGLGLPIVQSLVNALGGSITVRSALGEGSTFIVLLPQAVMPAAVGPAPQAEMPATVGQAPQAVHAGHALQPAIAERAPSSATRVLLVDDEVSVQKVTARLLSVLGCDVMLASNTTDALSKVSAADATIDLLVTDYRMPGRSGADLISAALELRPALRVVLVSGHIESATLPESIAHRVVLLRKPFARHELADAVAAALA